MKVALVNFSGSVGKTVSTSHLLAPRIPGAEIIAVESTNESAADLGLDVDQVRGEHFGKIFRKLLVVPAAIIDVGASNIEDFLGELVKYDQAQSEIDYYVLPVISSGKAQRETIKTIQALSAAGVDRNRIRVLFNRVDVRAVDEFEAIFAYERVSGSFLANPQAQILETELFDLLANRRTTIEAVLADATDYRQQLRETDLDDEESIERITDMIALRSLAKPVQRQLDDAFSALFA
ncbi:plasmid stability protein StbB [Pusillimonas caeni]|uniref:StbB family protein n=1 Tax=Pusillimonas caeni TaxID=1348472 RepID=UPI000E599480|nr:StbB family protein [Pusillimonas caeni]TFL14065.1 plasmid stability protein StbB [Pusillimonas caeni]